MVDRTITPNILAAPIELWGWGVIGFFLGLAQGVLTNVISDLVKGRRAVREREIRSSIEELAVARQRLSREQLDEVVQHVMAEIGALVDRDPDLEPTGRGGIKLADHVPRSRDVQGQQEVLAERFRRLEAVIEQRRKELELPTSGTNKESQAQPPSDSGPVVVWEQAEAPDAETWKRELEAMRRRIDQRRGRGSEDEPGSHVG